ncbi:MAG: nitrate ABC transporter substrate-binding protein [Thalassolituus sp.]|nr:MAG: nitrate ABC transporter substrate-binding protein [Thalassolituus sp.]
MRLHTKLALGLVILGIVSIGGYRIVQPMLDNASQASVSDVGAKGSIHIGVDGWVGYFPLCSPEMKKNLNREGYGLRCTDDAADYQSRFQLLKSSEYDFVVATVDSYLLNGEALNYPGPIIAVLDESKGGDAIIARQSKVPTLEALKQATDVHIAFTPDSPSHHLMKAVAAHFDVPVLREKRRHIESEGSEAAYAKLVDEKADVAVLWEPEVSKALANPEFVRLLGTEDTQQLIVDILIASQRVIKQNPDQVRSLLKAYFRTLKYYRENNAGLVKDIARHYNIKKSTAEELLKGVRWITMSENAEDWYGVDHQQFSSEALVRTIESAGDILEDNGDFSRSPIPDEDPYRLINSTFIKEMYGAFGNTGGFTKPGASKGATPVRFDALSPAQWNQLKAVGSLKTRQVKFSSGTANLTLAGKEKIDEVIADLDHYPNFRIEVRGHTGLRGNADANIALSQQRADAVLRYIRIAHDLDANRIRAVGLGGSKPLQRRAGESSRAYNYRLPRVEIALVREVL